MKKAFTMIELLFVIVVIGILSAMIIPNTQTISPLHNAAIQVASHLRYTQHLAMIDDTYDRNRIDTDGNVIWFKDRWQLVFSSSEYSDYKPAYTIFSDRQGNAKERGDANEKEIAKNPENIQQIMTGGYGSAQAINYGHSNFKGMKKLNIGNSYGVTSVRLIGGCSGSRIAFDHLGRPMKGDHNSVTSPYNMSSTYSASKQRLITSNCKIELKAEDKIVNIIIRPETGYTTIEY